MTVVAIERTRNVMHVEPGAFDFRFGNSDTPWSDVLRAYDEEVDDLLFQFTVIEHALHVDKQRTADAERRAEILRNSAILIPTSEYRVIE